MRKSVCILTLVLVPVVAYAAENGLKWAYPVEPPPGNNADAAPPSKPVNQALIAATYTGLPKMPEVVAKGKPLPCMQCHLANGGSHPESAAISGLSVNYIIEQVHAFRDGERVDVRTGRMVLASKAISEKELKEAAEYYAAIGPERQQWIKTVVSNDVPKGPAPFGDGGFPITPRAAARSHSRREWSSKWRRTTISFGHATRSTAASSNMYARTTWPWARKWRPRAHAGRAMAPITRALAMCLGSPGNTQFT
jgi:cytochrome c553